MLNSIQVTPILGYEHYTISTTGEVHNGHLTLKAFSNQRGYQCIKLSKQGTLAKHFTLHRLVATHYINNPENKAEVNHIDGDKLNNNMNNLEWVTSSENKQHGILNGLIVYNKPTENLKLGGQRKSKSKFYGVFWDSARNKWKSCVRKDNKIYGQKRFNTELEAAIYYNDLCDALSLNKPRNIV